MDTEPAPAEGREHVSVRVVHVLLFARAAIVIALGLTWLVSGQNVRLLGNLFATYLLAAGVMTLSWLRAHRAVKRWWLSVIGVVAAIGGAIVVLARVTIERATSTDVALAIVGATTIAIGGLRLAGALRDGPADHPHVVLARRLVLGSSEVGLGLLLVAASDLDRTVTTSAGLWALVGGTVMFLDAVAVLRAHRTRRRPTPEQLL